MLKEIVTVYAIISLIPFFIGLMEGSRGGLFSDCKSEMERIEYIVPAYRVGCYLGSVPGEK